MTARIGVSALGLLFLSMAMSISFAVLVHAEEGGESAPSTENVAPSETPSPATELSQNDPAPSDTTSTVDPTTPAAEGDSGTEGANGESVPETVPQPDGAPTTIETGDANSGLTTATEANTTTASTTASSTASSSPLETAPTDSSPAASSSAPVLLAMDNSLTATSTGSSTAGTGENIAVDPDGAVIKTGSSAAYGYLMSLFNIAITNSTGSILFLRNPLASMLDFTERIINAFSALAKNGECTFLKCVIDGLSFNILGNNVANVTNTLEVGATTGSNTASSTEGTAQIETGNANAFGSIVNFGNLLIADSRYLVILMNQEGSLSGNIILPDASFFKTLSSSAAVGSGSSVAVENTADISNVGTSSASTGDNTSSSTMPSTIATGDARAQMSTINFVNQIGAPICFIIAVGGTWDGDILQLPENFTRVQTDFGEVVCGTGSNARSGPVALDIQSKNYAKILNTAIVEATTGSNKIEGLAARMETGDARAFLQFLNVVNQSIIGQDWIFALFTIAGNWDGDMIFGVLPSGSPADQIAGQLLSGKKGDTGPTRERDAKITMTKTASLSTTTAPTTVQYTVVIKNNGGTLYNALLTDILYAPDGSAINKKTWELGTIPQNEEVVVKYDMQFSGNLRSGTYTNSARVTGLMNLNSSAEGRALPVAQATARIDIIGEPKVLGAMICPAYLTTYIRPLGYNDPSQVQLLETFLKESEGELIVPDGIYDKESIAAVKRFQERNAKDVLSPWGLERSTGYVYYMTQKKINDLYCKGYKEFALTSRQEAEIERYRSFAVGGSAMSTVVKKLLPTLPVGFAGLSALTQAAPTLYIDLKPEQPRSLFAAFLERLLSTLKGYAFIPHAEAAAK